MNLDLIVMEAAVQALMLAVAYALWRFPGRLRARRSREAARKARQTAEQSVIDAKAARAKAEEAARSAEVQSRMRARFERETRGYVPLEGKVHRGERITPAPQGRREKQAPPACTPASPAPAPQPESWSTWPSALGAGPHWNPERKDSATPIVSGGGGEFGGGGASGGWDSGSSCSDSGSGDSGSSSSCSSSSD